MAKSGDDLWGDGFSGACAGEVVKSLSPSLHPLPPLLPITLQHLFCNNWDVSDCPCFLRSSREGSDEARFSIESSRSESSDDKYKKVKGDSSGKASK